MRRRGLLAVLLLLGCRATTGRPPFVPLPEAAHGEIGFGLADVGVTIARLTRIVADALVADSLPVTLVREADGYVETPWLEAETLAPSRRDPLGPDVVRVRAWVTPAKPGYGTVEVETVFRPVADPSRPERELEVHVPDGHPVGRRVAQVVQGLVARYGEPTDTAGPARQVRPTAAPPPVDPPAPARPDTAGR